MIKFIYKNDILHSVTEHQSDKVLDHPVIGQISGSISLITGFI